MGYAFEIQDARCSRLTVNCKNDDNFNNFLKHFLTSLHFYYQVCFSDISVKENQISITLKLKNKRSKCLLT